VIQMHIISNGTLILPPTINTPESFDKKGKNSTLELYLLFLGKIKKKHIYTIHYKINEF